MPTRHSWGYFRSKQNSISIAFPTELGRAGLEGWGRAALPGIKTSPVDRSPQNGKDVSHTGMEFYYLKYQKSTHFLFDRLDPRRLHGAVPRRRSEWRRGRYHGHG